MPVWCFQGALPDLATEEVISGLMFQGKCIITWWFSWALLNSALTSDGFCRRCGTRDGLSHMELLQLAIRRDLRREEVDRHCQNIMEFTKWHSLKSTFQETININYPGLGRACQDVSGAEVTNHKVLLQVQDIMKRESIPAVALEVVWSCTQLELWSWFGVLRLFPVTNRNIVKCLLCIW